MHDSRHGDALDRANRAPGGGMSLGLGESVSTWNGNLHVSAAAGPSYVLPWGFSLGVARVYDSHRVHLDRVQTGKDDAGNPVLEDFLSGRSWVGLGWRLHLGRIYRSREYLGEDGPLFYGEGSSVFETPGGELVPFEPTDPRAQPKVKYEYFRSCEEEPQRPPYCDRHPEYPSCDDALDGCEGREDDPVEHWLVTQPDGTVYRLERIVDDEKLSGGWLRNHDRAGFYPVRITGVTGHEVVIRYHYRECADACGDDQACLDDCAARYPYPEALKSIESGDYRLDFEVYGPDDGVPSCVVGMLKEVRGTTVPADGEAPEKTASYRFEYDVVTIPDGPDGPVEVPLLRRVTVTGSDGSDGGTTTYLYGDEPEQGIGNVGDVPLLREVRHPLGAVSRYEYGTWTSGVRSTDGGGVEPRTVTGVVRRDLYPDGVGAGARVATWRWTRHFEAASCSGISPGDETQQYELILPDGTRRRWTYDGHPCGDESRDEWGPTARVRTERVVGTDGEALQETAYEWDYERDEDGRIVRVLARKVRTTWFDDTGSCFGDGTGHGTARSTVVTWSERNGWDFWERREVSGDYLRDGETWASVTDYEDPADAAECRVTNHVIGAWRSRSVEYAGWKATETAEFDCRGNLVRRTTRRTWDAVPEGEENTSGDALVVDVSLDGSNREVSRTLSGGDGDASYTTERTWTDDASGHVRETKSPAVAWRLAKEEYDSLGNLLALEDASGIRTTREYDALRRVTATRTTEQPGTRTTWVDLRHVRTVVSPDGSAGEYDPSNPGHVLSETVYDGLGRVIERWRSRPDGGKEVRVWRYDAMGRVVFVSAWMKEEDWSSAEKATWETADGSWSVTDVPLRDGHPWGTVAYYGVPDDPSSENPLRITPDPLGRLRRVRRANGTVLLRDYCGIHDRTGPDLDGDGSIDDGLATRRYRDALGHVVVVDAPGESADAVYTWGPAGLVEVRLFDGSGGNLYQRWRSGELASVEGQVRTFRYDAAGQLVERNDPERGRVVYDGYDAAGHPLAWRDELALVRGYFYRARYDGLGRVVAVEKVRGTPDAPEETELDRLTGDGGFEGGWGSWRRGVLQDGAFVEDPTSYWKIKPYSELPFDPPPAREGETNAQALVFTNDAGTDYGDAPAGPQALLYAVTGVTRDDVLSLSFWRQVRDGAAGKDAFRVYVGLGDGSDLSGRRLVLDLDGSVSSWATWRRWIEVRPGDLLVDAGWPEGETRDVYVLLVFEKGDEETSGLGFGLAVDDVFLGRHGVERLVERSWDEDHCAAGTVAAEACTDAGDTSRVHGKPTTVTGWAGNRPVSRRRYVYGGAGGRLVALEDWLDWTAAAAEPGQGGATWVTRFGWDDLGGLSEWVAPRLAGIEAERVYHATYRHGYLAGLVIGDDQPVLDPDAATPAIEYAAGAIPRVLRYGNGTETVIERDVLGRVASILVTGPDAESGTRTLWDTGAYTWDWRGNLVQIANLRYDYDAVGHLVRAEVAPTARNGLPGATPGGVETIAYEYDRWGNLLRRDWADDEQVTPGAPTGMEVLNRSVDPETNRVADAGFRYDAAGRLVSFPGKADQQVTALWTDGGQLRAFMEGTPGSGGRPDEIYLYDGDGKRFARIPVGRRGNPQLSIRDTAGQVLSDYEVVPGSGPELVKDYVYAFGRVVAEREVVSEAPHLMSSSLGAGREEYGFTVPGADPAESYELDIETVSGYRNWVSGVHPDAGGVLTLAEAELSPGETNFVRVRRLDPDGTERSAPVAVTYDPGVDSGSANQVRAISVTRDGTQITIRWRLNEENGKPFRVYFRRGTDGQVIVLNAQPLSADARMLVLEDQALAAPCGEFWLTQLEVGINGNVTGESDPGPAADLPSSRPGGGQPVNPCDPPGPDPGDGLRRYSFVVHFHHRDHLGSLRVVTGEAGLEESATDWYPFGLEMVPDGQEVLSVSRKKYTGHERDEETGLDYMFARYKAARFGFFLSPDPVDDVDISVPISWNKYAYVRMNPLTLWDPFGLEKKETCTDQDGDGSDDNTGTACGGGGASSDEDDVSCGTNESGAFECRTSSHTTAGIPVVGTLGPPQLEVAIADDLYHIYIDGMEVLHVQVGDSGLPNVNLGGGPLDTVANRVRSNREFSICVPVSGEREAWLRANDAAREYTRLGRAIDAAAVGAVDGAVVSPAVVRLLRFARVGAPWVAIAVTAASATGAAIREWNRSSMILAPGDTVELQFVPAAKEDDADYYVVPVWHPGERYEGQAGECPR